MRLCQDVSDQLTTSRYTKNFISMEVLIPDQVITNHKSGIVPWFFGDKGEQLVILVSLLYASFEHIIPKLIWLGIVRCIQDHIGERHIPLVLLYLGGCFCYLLLYALSVCHLCSIDIPLFLSFAKALTPSCLFLHCSKLNDMICHFFALLSREILSCWIYSGVCANVFVKHVHVFNCVILIVPR